MIASLVLRIPLCGNGPPWEVLSAPGRSCMKTHQGCPGRGSKSGWKMVSVSKIIFTCGKGAHLMPPRCPPALCQLTHRRVLTDQQVRLKEVVDKEGQPVHLAWKSEDKSVSQGPTCMLHAFSKGTQRGWAAVGTASVPCHGRLQGKWTQRGHQLRVATEPWSTVSCAEV